MKNTLFIFGVLGLFVFATTPPSSSTDQETSIFIVDTLKSTVEWKAMIHTGNVNFLEGELEYDERLTAMNLVLDMKNLVNTDVENELLKGTLENVLKSPDFFNIEKFPKAYFELHESTKKEDNYIFTADFTLFDNWSVCTDFEGQVELKGDSIYITTERIPFDRTDWGIYYLSKNNPFPKEEEDNMEVPDTIFVKAHIVAYRKEK